VLARRPLRKDVVGGEWSRRRRAFGQVGQRGREEEAEAQDEGLEGSLLLVGEHGVAGRKVGRGDVSKQEEQQGRSEKGASEEFLLQGEVDYTARLFCGAAGGLGEAWKKSWNAVNKWLTGEGARLNRLCPGRLFTKGRRLEKGFGEVQGVVGVISG